MRTSALSSRRASGAFAQAALRTYTSRCANYGWWIAGLCVVLLWSCAALAQEKHLSIYAPQTFYQISVVDRPTGEYVGLLELLEPLGKIESHVDGKKWKLRFTPGKAPIEAEFEAGRRSGKVRGAQFDLGGEFFLQGDRGYVPISSLPNLLPRMLDRTVELHATARRLFLSGAAVKSTLEVRHDPTRLVASFPSPVTPAISAGGNRVRIVFNRDPVVSPGATSASYNDPPLTSATFSEANGGAALEVLGSSALQAVSSEGGKVITVSAAPTTAAQTEITPAATPVKPETPLPPPNVPTATPTAVRPSSGRRNTVVVIDAAHGGEERGAQLTDKLNEKDVTLALARRIQHELETRGFTVILVRNGDATMTFDQRATTANSSRAGIYLGVHAATLGTGARVYTALLAPAPVANRRTFLPWESAQAPYVEDSTTVARSIVSEFTSRKIPARSIAAPLRPLNNIAGMAVAIEIAPEGDTVESINDAKYQQNVAAAVAAGIAAARGKLESQ